MITDDYVSFEVAKLLRDKGFQEKCIAFYPCIDLKSKLTFGGRVNYNGPNKFKMRPPVSAPTLQMAMKWLRDAHSIHISPFKVSICHWSFQIFNLLDSDTSGCKPMDINVPSKYYMPSYEWAAETAIKYVLENLIN